VGRQEHALHQQSGSQQVSQALPPQRLGYQSEGRAASPRRTVCPLVRVTAIWDSIAALTRSRHFTHRSPRSKTIAVLGQDSLGVSIGYDWVHGRMPHPSPGPRTVNATVCFQRPHFSNWISLLHMKERHIEDARFARLAGRVNQVVASSARIITHSLPAPHAAAPGRQQCSMPGKQPFVWGPRSPKSWPTGLAFPQSQDRNPVNSEACRPKLSAESRRVWSPNLGTALLGRTLREMRHRTAGSTPHAFRIGDEDRLPGESRSPFRSLMAGRNDVLAHPYPTPNASSEALGAGVGDAKWQVAGEELGFPGRGQSAT
jgi:hypothetical protein